MLRIGICDDQLNARDALRFELEKILRDKSEQIVYEFSTGASAVRWLEKHPGEIDLLFLDVEMDGISGMDAAAQIRNFDKEICLVFVTGYTSNRRQLRNCLTSLSGCGNSFPTNTTKPFPLRTRRAPTVCRFLILPIFIVTKGK